MAYVQNFNDPVKRIQEENVFIANIPELSDPDDSDEDNIID